MYETILLSNYTQRHDSVLSCKLQAWRTTACLVVIPGFAFVEITLSNLLSNAAVGIANNAKQ